MGEMAAHVGGGHTEWAPGLGDGLLQGDGSHQQGFPQAGERGSLAQGSMQRRESRWGEGQAWPGADFGPGTCRPYSESQDRLWNSGLMR